MAARQLPSIEEVMRKEYLVIEDLAVLLSTSVDGISTKIKQGTVPKPRRRGRRNYWKKAIVIGWMDGDMNGDEPWTPPPHTPRPPASRPGRG